MAPFPDPILGAVRDCEEFSLPLFCFFFNKVTRPCASGLPGIHKMGYHTLLEAFIYTLN